MRIRLIYFLSLGILLLGGGIKLFADTYLSTNCLKTSKTAYFYNTKDIDVIFVSPISHGEQQRQTLNLLFENEGENEIISLKKRFESSYCPVKIYFNPIPSDHLSYCNTAKSFHNFTSYRCYLLNQVFRI